MPTNPNCDASAGLTLDLLGCNRIDDPKNMEHPATDYHQAMLAKRNARKRVLVPVQSHAEGGSMDYHPSTFAPSVPEANNAHLQIRAGDAARRNHYDQNTKPNDSLTCTTVTTGCDQQKQKDNSETRR